MPFDVTYDRADVEVVPAGLINDWPAQAIRVRLDNYWPAIMMVSSALFYWFVLVKWGFPSTRPTDDAARKRCNTWRNRHNLVLFIFSAISCFSTAAWLFVEGQLFDWKALLCTPVEGTWVRALSIVFVLSKIWEWIDTAFLIWLGTRPPEFLHLYHHATTFWLFCFVINMPGPEKFGLLMNGGVHTLMYSHYWRPWPKSLVPLITLLQIAQLITVNYAWTVSPATCPAAPFADGFEKHPLEFITPYTMVPVYLWFFIVFFVKRFILKKKSTPKDAKKSS